MADAPRRRVEEKLATNGGEPEPALWQDPRALVHELQVYRTELEIQNEELRHAHEQADILWRKFEDLYDFAPVGYLTLDERGVIREANLSAAAFLGIGRKRLLQTPFIAFLTPSSALVFQAFMRLALEKRSKEKFEARLLPQGEAAPRDILIQGVAEGAGDEKAKNVRIVLIDITERKRTEDALLRREAELAEAQRVAGLGFWTFELATKAVWWSDELYRIFEMDKAEFSGTYEAFLSLIHPEDRDRVLLANARARAGGDSFEMEYRIITRSHQLKHLREVGYSRKDGSGCITGLFGTAQDISRFKLLEHELIEKNEHLQNLNTALKVILDQRDMEKKRFEETFSESIDGLVLPYLDQIRRTGLNTMQEECLRVLEANIREIVNPFSLGISGILMQLSPAETRVLKHIRQGRSIKEIASLLSISPRTVESHRNRLRKKLGITGRKINLKTHLANLE